MKKFSQNYVISKIIIFILTIVLFLLSAICILSIKDMINADVYQISKKDFLERRYETLIQKDTRELLESCIKKDLPNWELAESFCSQKNFAFVEIWMNDSERTVENTLMNWQNEDATPGYTSTHKWKTLSDHEHYLWDGVFDRSGMIRYIRISIAESPNYATDHYQEIYTFTNIVYAIRFWIFVAGFLFILSGIACFIRLMRMAGKKTNRANESRDHTFQIPFDLLTLGAIFILRYPLAYIRSSFELFENRQLTVILAFIVMEIIILGWSMSLSAHLKQGHLRKPQLMFPICKNLLKLMPVALKELLSSFRRLPLIVKAIILFFLCVLQGYSFLSMHHSLVLIRFYIPQLIVEFLIVLYFAYMFQKLKKGSTALASGDLTYQTDTRFMIWDMKQHGNNLNNIANGMNTAIEEQLKSERMKTELITNVSHDIKTPITSIISYTVFLKKEIQQESCDMEKIQEYADVLQRQSVRLKRLLEDLVEASKAATGNLEVNLEPCDAGILLAQATGEYEQRLDNADLTLITKQPDEPIQLIADSQLLWRVFDNLLNNICKYAQAGTRVYLTLEKQTDFAIITFKNTSRDALDVSAEELMERFVRGDVSRHTEGNGLGLSIAKSLIELQKGTMELTIDGDLFKVTLRLPMTP